jgi:hypothetical protein
VSASLRRFRAQIGTYRDAGTQGDVVAQYLRVSSGETDHLWNCSLAQPTGREVTTGMKAEARVDAVIGFLGEVTVTESGAIRIDGVDYLVRAVLDRPYGRDEIEVYAERSPHALTWVTT